MWPASCPIFRQSRELTSASISVSRRGPHTPCMRCQKASTTSLAARALVIKPVSEPAEKDSLVRLGMPVVTVLHGCGEPSRGIPLSTPSSVKRKPAGKVYCAYRQSEKHVFSQCGGSPYSLSSNSRIQVNKRCWCCVQSSGHWLGSTRV